MVEVREEHLVLLGQRSQINAAGKFLARRWGGDVTSLHAQDCCKGPECHPSLAQGMNHLVQKKFWLVKAKPMWHLNHGVR